MSHLANQIAQSITRVAIFAFSMLLVPFGLSSAPAFANQNLPDAPKTELVSHTSATRYHSYKQAVVDYHQSFLRSNCYKINLLAISRLDDRTSNNRFIQATYHALEIKASHLSLDRYHSYFTYNQEVIAHS
ncbi:MAG: hypothetical protein RIF36_10720 [Imperialibacter sp.]|uniref:hypothetical protein n=1 Tax=Imperialibacter sp. TaxID=2038411 RepID=UPI0032EB9141